MDKPTIPYTHFCEKHQFKTQLMLRPGQKPCCLKCLEEDAFSLNHPDPGLVAASKKAMKAEKGHIDLKIHRTIAHTIVCVVCGFGMGWLMCFLVYMW